MSTYAMINGEDRQFADVNSAIDEIETLIKVGQRICISCDGRHVATVSADDSGTVTDKHCCSWVRKGEWEERAGGMLHCPWCGDRVAKFRQ